MKIVLCDAMILAAGLTYEQADEALRKAGKTKAAKYIDFYMTSGISSWNLVGRPKALTQKFINDPESFVIEV